MLTISSKTEMTRDEFTATLLNMGYKPEVIDELFLEAQAISDKIVETREEES